MLDSLNPKFSYFLGKTYFKLNDTVIGLNYIRNCINIDSGYAPAYIELAELKIEGKYYDSAVYFLTKAIDYPGTEISVPYCLRKRSDLYFLAGKDTPAINDLNLAISLNPTDTNAYYMKGLYYYKGGNDSAALLNSEKSLQMNANYSPALSLRGSVFLNQNKFSEAESDIKKSLIHQP